jgi:hypothetical protein
MATLTFRRERNAACPSHEKNHSQLDFELLDPLRDCATREIQLFGRTFPRDATKENTRSAFKFTFFIRWLKGDSFSKR